MTRTTAHLDAPPDAVFAVASDPWRFADWVVGAKCIRAVDHEWPEPGSRFHHRFGVGPFTIDDSTVLEEIDPPRKLVLRARARPTGVARVTLEFAAAHDGGTDVVMDEAAISGPAKWLQNPLTDVLVTGRNSACLHRLGDLASTEARGVR